MRAPGLEPASVFFDLVRAETRLYNALADRLRTAHGISLGAWEFLRSVGEHPGCRVADLAAWFAVGVGATSKSLDRLEKAGWLARRPNPSDRRSSVLELTDEGTAIVAAARPTFESGLDELLARSLTGSQLAALGEALSVVRTSLESARLGVPAG